MERISYVVPILSKRRSNPEYEAGWWYRLTVRWHQWRCTPCRIFAAQMARVSASAKSMVDPEEKLSGVAHEQIVARCLEGQGCEDSD